MSGNVSLASAKSTPDAGLPGQIADTGPHVIHSYTAAAAVDFGVAVRRTGKDTCTAISATGQEVAGISVRDVTVKTGASTITYTAGDSVGVMEQGRIFALPYEDVARNAAVYARVSDGRLGTTTTASLAIAVPGAKWEETVTSASALVGRIRINTPG